MSNSLLGILIPLVGVLVPLVEILVLLVGVSFLSSLVYSIMSYLVVTLGIRYKVL